MSSKEQDAMQQLKERGAENIKREDRFGETKSGWWLDETFLGKDPLVAIQVLKGGS